MCMGTSTTFRNGMNATTAQQPEVPVSGRLLFEALWLGNNASWPFSCKLYLACGKEVLFFYVM